MEDSCYQLNSSENLKMNVSEAEIIIQFYEWLQAWNKHNLEEVMKLIHDDIVFENWTGVKIVGKRNLQRSWIPWFLNHGNFKFTEEKVFFDEKEQKMTFMWQLEWPSLIQSFKGKNEIRRGVDILKFKDGKIIKKLTYSKTTIEIDKMPLSLEK